MPPVAFLALLTITLLIVAAFRLELDFRRSGTVFRRSDKERPEPEARPSRPELRAAPAGGYGQAPLPTGLFGKK